MHSLPFAPPALSDAAAARQAACSACQSDLAFANMFLLRQKYGTELAFEDGFLFRYFAGHGRLQGYAFPCGEGDSERALRRIEEDAAWRSRPLRFCLLTEAQVEVLQRVFPGRFRVVCDPGDADYMYERLALAELPGARFHRKRNHVARFKRECPTWNVRLLCPENKEDARSVAAGWLAGCVEEDASTPPPALLHEYEAIAHALELMQELQLCGVVLYVGVQPVGMAVASMISPEVADVHYEKCLPSFRLAYPLLCQALASSLSCSLVNREEDLNVPGLRQAKMSLFPCLVLSKFSAVPC